MPFLDDEELGGERLGPFGEGAPPLGVDQEPETAREETAEPGGEEDPANELEILEATEAAAAEPAPGAEDPVAEEDPAAEGPVAEAVAEEDPAAEGSGAEAVAEEDPAAVVERQRDEYLALAQRTQADFENYRKRAAREVAAAGERAKGTLVRELLPVIDNLERALASAQEGEQHLAEGVRLVHSELVLLLERNGVEQFDPSGERFDPAFHEALSTRADEATDSGVVLDVVEKGYRSDGTVLRPARVVVSD